jgi:hypothetical protein
MEIKITTKQILKILQVVSWIIFIGLCIEAGGIVFSAIYTFAINPAKASNFWEGADLSNLYNFDHGQFIVIAIFMTIVAVLKAILFYLIIKLFVEKKLRIAQPFSLELRKFISNASYLALGIGLFSHSGCNYSEWLSKQKVDMPDPQSLQLGGADVWLFMAVILFLVTQLVKRGIEIQNENDLTI